MATMTQHVVRMTRDMNQFSERAEKVVFVPSDQDEDSDLWESFDLDWDVWTRLDRPSEIVVTITPAQPNVGNIEHV